MENDVSSEPRETLSPERYLELERASESRNEFLDGKMFAMTGASARHNRIVLNAAVELQQQLGQTPCEIYASDMRVKVPAVGLYTYPDVVVVCEPPRTEDASADTLLNPRLIIEVLSPSTESYDRGKKFAHYRSLASLVEYVLISQSECRIEQFILQDDGKWVLYGENTDPEGSVELKSVACQLMLSRIYRRVEFE